MVPQRKPTRCLCYIMTTMTSPSPLYLTIITYIIAAALLSPSQPLSLLFFFNSSHLRLDSSKNVFSQKLLLSSPNGGGRTYEVGFTLAQSPVSGSAWIGGSAMSDTSPSWNNEELTITPPTKQADGNGPNFYRDQCLQHYSSIRPSVV